MAHRAAPGTGTIRKKTVTRNGKEYSYWEARATVGRDPATGRQKQRSFTGQTQAEVARKLTAALAAVDEGIYKAPSRLTVGNWLDIWARDYLGGVKAGTLRVYTANIENRIKPAFGAVKLDELSPHAVQRLYNDLAAELSPKSVQGVHAVLHHALQQALRLGYIRSNPTELCTLPRVEKKELRPLDEEESRAFLEEIKGHRFQTLFTVALLTGLREGELLGLSWANVDFKGGTLRVCQQLQHTKCGYTLTTPKNGKGRTVAPAPYVMALLKHHKALQAAQRLTVGEIWEDSGLVFVDGIGHHLAPATVYSAFKAVAKKIDRPDARFHDLRHSYAVAAIRAGDDIKTVQGNLGHATAAFTLDVYGHITEQMRKDSAQRMEQYATAALGL